MNPRTARISLGLNFILTLLLIYFLVDTEDDRFKPDEIRTDVEEFLHDYHAAMETKGLTGEFDYLDTTSQFFWVPPGFDSWISFDSVKTILLATDPQVKEIKLTWEDLRIDVLSAEIAVYTGRIAIKQTVNDDFQDFRLLETGVVVKRNGEWKILSGQSRVM